MSDDRILDAEEPSPIYVHCEGSGCPHVRQHCSMCGCIFGMETLRAWDGMVPSHKRMDILSMFERGDFDGG